MKSNVASSVVVLALFLAVLPAAVASTTWYVDGVNGSDANDCKSSTTACKTIAHAISLASSGDSVSVAAATYVDNLTISISLKVLGAGASTTIIDGGAANTVISVNSGQVTLSALTVQNGSAPAGGGIYNQGTLTINHSTITRNATKVVLGSGNYGGGGIYNLGSVTINNSTLSGNTANVGAGFRPSAEGGGIFNAGTLSITKSTISGNSARTTYGSGATAQGGGIFNAGTLTFDNSTLSGNSATSPGDKRCGSSYGGGIYNAGTLTFDNSTLSGNSVAQCIDRASYGGSIYAYAGQTATLQDTIVANSTGGNCYGAILSRGYNLSSDSTCNFSGTGDLNNTDPKLGPLQNNGGPTQTQALLPGSPAIDAGNPNGCTDGTGHLLKTDQRGAPRPDKEDISGCDMGAYEKQTD